MVNTMVLVWGIYLHYFVTHEEFVDGEGGGGAVAQFVGKELMFEEDGER